uniref:Uncharacterized protein n=1 Tax=Chromera velia CCMP2878 TaxID=1169474 RepID=A0A0G4IAM2_9ALVE|eukprot:Cvel_12489.t1-p1 / transcript=Cvel_12489.t1 / gene=Cvel_12489 / organism=Chromera_velia_CCMP2878 / gene_product=hypothetical protein / transcript_product=hypothetical protein / location=Cvel_scaffold819:27854-28849(+) / protein_length=249 / sequence_SO=supercontig / SO=protein_coding / is_pseudo=false
MHFLLNIFLSIDMLQTVLKISSLSIRWTALRAPTALGVALPPGAGYESEYVQRGHSPMRREVAKAPAETPHLQIRALIRDARQELLRVKEYHTVCAALKGRLRLSMPSKSPLPTVAARKTSGGSTQTVDQGDREETDRTLKEVDKKIRECEAALLDLLIRIQNEADLRAGGFSPRRQPSPSPPPQKSNNNLEATQTDNPGPYFDLSVSPPRKIKQASPQKPNLPSPSRRSNSPVMRNMRVLFDGSFAGL